MLRTKSEYINLLLAHNDLIHDEVKAHPENLHLLTLCLMHQFSAPSSYDKYHFLPQI